MHEVPLSFGQRFRSRLFGFVGLLGQAGVRFDDLEDLRPLLPKLDVAPNRWSSAAVVSYAMPPHDTGEDDLPAPVRVEIEFAGQGVNIGVEGYGVSCVADDARPHEHGVIFLENFPGDGLVLRIWADINQEDPTHVIPLDGAKLSARKPEDHLDA